MAYNITPECGYVSANIWLPCVVAVGLFPTPHWLPYHILYYTTASEL